MSQIINTPFSALTLNDLMKLAGEIILLYFVGKIIFYAIFRKPIEKSKRQKENNAWKKEILENGGDPKWVDEMVDE